MKREKYCDDIYFEAEYYAEELSYDEGSDDEHTTDEKGHLLKKRVINHEINPDLKKRKIDHEKDETMKQVSQLKESSMESKKFETDEMGRKRRSR